MNSLKRVSCGMGAVHNSQGRIIVPLASVGKQVKQSFAVGRLWSIGSRHTRIEVRKESPAVLLIDLAILSIKCCSWLVCNFTLSNMTWNNHWAKQHSTQAMAYNITCSNCTHISGHLFANRRLWARISCGRLSKERLSGHAR